MKHILACVLAFCALSVVSSFAGEIDDGYVKAFGRGIILVSQKGFIEKKTYDPSQFDFKNGVFRIPSGGEAELNVRAILPAGKTLGAELDKVKKTQAGNLKWHQGDYCGWRVWSSHEGSENLVTAAKPWPKKLGDEPMWADSKDVYTALSADVRDWWAPGTRYEGDFRGAFFGLMATSQPGQKLYISFHVAFEYKTPGGEMQSKWDSDKNKFVQVESNGELGYALSEPLCAATVEFK